MNLSSGMSADKSADVLFRISLAYDKPAYQILAYYLTRNPPKNVWGRRGVGWWCVNLFYYSAFF